MDGGSAEELGVGAEVDKTRAVAEAFEVFFELVGEA